MRAFSFLRSYPSTAFRKPLFLVSLMLFTWTLFDGTVSYISPLAITKAGFSETSLGLIIGSSSVAGAVFDFLLSKFMRNTHYRRVYLLMFVLSFLFPFLLWKASTIWMFFAAMAVWGFYYDLENFGNFDYVGRKLSQEEHARGFGIMSIFKNLGYMLAPLITGFIIGTYLDWKPYILMLIFLFLSLIFYIALFVVARKNKQEFIADKEIKRKSFPKEISVWQHIIKLLFPVLILTMFLNILDAFFWTIGPIIAENFSSIHPFNGLFMTAYSFPTLLAGWVVGNFAKKFGKKKTAFLSFSFGCLILSYFALAHNPLIFLLIVFLSSCFTAIAWPAINGAYADYIAESPSYEKEIESIEDFFTNIGYVVGPILAGFLADKFGNITTFSLLGSTGAVIGILLIWITPRKIHVVIPYS